MYKTIKNGGLKVVELSSALVAVPNTGDTPAGSWTRYDAINQVKWEAAGLIKLEYKTSEKTGKMSVKRLPENKAFYQKRHGEWKAEAKRINAEIKKIEDDNKLEKQTLKVVKDAASGEVKRYVKRASHRNMSQPHHMRAKAVAKVKQVNSELAKAQAEVAAMRKQMAAMIKPAPAVDPMAAKLDGLDGLQDIINQQVQAALAGMVKA